jgi:hypothetical protein
VIELHKPKPSRAKHAVRTLIATLSALALAPAAVAASHHPTGEYAQFKGCPLSHQTLTTCIYSVSTGGSFTIGKKTVPIKNPVTLQGGFEGGGETIKFFGAEGGETFSQTPQVVPNGLSGISAPSSWPRWLQEEFNAGLHQNGRTDVTATLLLAAPSTSIKLNTEHLIGKSGTALGLPAKVKLENPFLGSSCYIGSDKNPIEIDFSTGKSGGIEGSISKAKFNSGSTITTISKGRIVNNTFSAPAASGCGGIFSSFFDPLVNSLLGTPSGAGQNAAILEGEFQAAAAPSVRESE